MTSLHPLVPLLLLLLTGGGVVRCYVAPIYTWPLGRLTGNSEVKHGTAQGSVGAIRHAVGLPALNYDAILFTGETYSFLQLKVDTQYALNTDIAFMCSVYLDSNAQGTVFHHRFDRENNIFSLPYISDVRLYLSSGRFKVTILWKVSGGNNGVFEAAGSVQPTGQWITVAVSYDISNGKPTVYINEEKYDLSSLPGGTPMALPATIAIGARHGGSELLSARVTCFQIALTKYDVSHSATYMAECRSENWIIQPTADCSRPCSEALGYYDLVAMENVPVASPDYSLAARSTTECAAMCARTEYSCASFFTNKVSGVCLLYGGNHGQQMTTSDLDTRYFVSKTLCCI